MIAAVFDCVAYVQAAISDQGPAAACLTFAEEGQVKVFASSAVLAEVRGTLSSKKLQARFSHLTEDRIERFLQRIGQIAALVDDVPAKFSLPRDPDDAMYVDLADAAQAAFIVSRDKDLLSLMNDDVFRKAYPDIVILDPTAFLNHVRTIVAKKLGYE